jgi:hypothetical protein
MPPGRNRCSCTVFVEVPGFTLTFFATDPSFRAFKRFTSEHEPPSWPTGGALTSKFKEPSTYTQSWTDYSHVEITPVPLQLRQDSTLFFEFHCASLRKSGIGCGKDAGKAPKQ